MSVTSKQNQIRKIYGIVKLKTDIIFLSDVRICNRNLVNGISDILCVFQINPYQSYNFVYNSSSNKRGVGMYTYYTPSWFYRRAGGSGPGGELHLGPGQLQR